MPTKILAIDDSKTMRLAIKITFAAEDAEVVAVSKGSEALVRAKQMPADVILLDHALASGEPTGFDVCKAIKADPETASVPVVLMIPAHGGVGATEVQACGADASLRKPFETQELIDTVGRVVGQAVSRRPAADASEPERPAPTPVAPSPSSSTATVARIQPRPASAPTPAAEVANAAVAPTPVSTPVAAPAPAAAARATPAGAPASAAAGSIPIAIPIPFAPADAPTPGMLARLRAAAPADAVDGLDPQAVAALLRLSHEVVEQVVWEVVPDLAAEIIEQRAQEELRARAGAE